MSKKKKFQSRKARPEQGPKHDRGWLYGHHAALAAIANPKRAIRRIILATGVDGALTEAVKQARATGAEDGEARPAPEMRDRGQLDELAGFGAVHQGLLVQADPLPAPDLGDLIDLAEGLDGACVMVLDQATDPRNIGAVMRTAAAFGAIGLVVQDRHAPEMTATMAKAASSAAEVLPLVRVTNIARAIEDLKAAAFWAIGFDGAAEETLEDDTLKGRVAVVLGAEGSGLRRLVGETCDRRVKIPISGVVESLNLSNAATVALYAFMRANP